MIELTSRVSGILAGSIKVALSVSHSAARTSASAGISARQHTARGRADGLAVELHAVTFRHRDNRNLGVETAPQRLADGAPRASVGLSGPILERFSRIRVHHYQNIRLVKAVVSRALAVPRDIKLSLYSSLWPLPRGHGARPLPPAAKTPRMWVSLQSNHPRPKRVITSRKAGRNRDSPRLLSRPGFRRRGTRPWGGRSAQRAYRQNPADAASKRSQ